MSNPALLGTPRPPPPQLLGDTLKGFGFPDTVVKAVTTPFTVAKDGACVQGCAPTPSSCCTRGSIESKAGLPPADTNEGQDAYN